MSRQAKTDTRREMRSGFMTWILLLCFGVASVLASCLVQRSRVCFRRSIHILESRLAYQLAASATDCTIARLAAALAPGSGPLHERLSADGVYEELVGPLELESLPGLEDDLDALRTSVHEGRGVELDVELAIDRLEPLVAATESELGRDGREKNGTFTITARAKIGKTPRSLVLQRAFKIINLVAPVTSRFTLFVREPSVGGDGYNRFRNTIDGGALPGEGSILPLRFLHHGEDGPATGAAFDGRLPGWVYLGGDQPLVLNLTSGHDAHHGEGFHFHSMQESGSLTERSRLDYLVDPRGPGAPDLFRIDFTHRHWRTGAVSRVDFKLKRRRLGFFERDTMTPPGDMDAGLLGIDPATDNVRSSTLHLFGTPTEPSPTLVFGDVQRAFPEYAGVVVDVDGDGRQDASLRPLLAKESDQGDEGLPPFFEVSSGGESRKYLLEDLADESGEPGLLEGPDARAFGSSTNFSGDLTYEDARSQIVVEPYLNGLDTLVAEKTEVPAPRAESLAAESYPMSSATVSILREDAAEVDYFSGDLERAGEGAARRRLTYRFDSLEQFAMWSGQDLTSGTLKLGCAVRIDGKSLDLQGVRTVSEGGLLAAPSLEVAALDRQGPVPVSLVALDGDITCRFTGRVEASLVALTGAVTGGPDSREVDLVGNIAARTLAPDAFPAGGTVRYDTDLDPARRETTGYGASYRTFVADASTSWRIAR